MSTAAAPLPGSRADSGQRRTISFGLLALVAFSAAAVGAGLGRAIVTTYLPVLLERIQAAPGLIGTVLLVNAAAGFAVPLAVGVWSDRLRARGRARALPLVLGGAVVTGGGLLAIGLGSATSYAVLTVFALLAYVGLNTVTTAHRAFVPESFAPEGRARATGAQELAVLLGGLVGIAVGGALIDANPLLLFALAATLVPLLAAPTVIGMRGRETFEGTTKQPARRGRAYYLRALRTPGVAPLLGAQVLWVLGYAALPAFFILYADSVLGMAPSTAALWLVAFGVLTGLTMVIAGRARRVGGHRALLGLGVALMGGGFLVVASSAHLTAVAPGLLGAAVGFGLVSTIGFPLFSTLIPTGETGGYTAMYFSVRAIASAVALPAAGWTIAVTGSYRSLFVVGGVATIAALIPLARVPGEEADSGLLGRRRLPIRTSVLIAPVTAAAAAVAGGALAALALSGGPIDRADRAAFEAINGLGPWPSLAFDALNPHLRNYGALLAIGLIAAVLTRRRVGVVATFIVGSWFLAYGLATAVTVATHRPRPEEVTTGVFQGEWADFASFPSGHAAVTAAITISIAMLFPRLRQPMLGYLLLLSVSRVAFGAHFPLDVVGGVAVGYASVVAVGLLLANLGVMTSRPRLIGAGPASPEGRRGALETS